MKRFKIALAVIAALAAVSCQKEKDVDGGAVINKETDVVFVLKGAPQTKSSEGKEVISTNVYPVTVKDTEEQFYLEESIEYLDDLAAPSTKATPAYTENVGTLYEDMKVYAAGNFGTQTYASMNSKDSDAGWRYNYTYATSPWPESEDTPVDFYLTMPATQKGVTGSYTYGKTNGNHTISFSYTSPTTTADQQDILFAARSASKQDYLNSLPAGIPVLFHHALTAVKFRIVNNDEVTKGKEGRTQTYITKVTLNGLKNKGNCVVTPRQEKDYGYADNRTGDYSSGDGSTVVWTIDDNSTASFSQEYTEAQNITEFNSGNSSDKPESFYAAANDNNLNDAAATMTFWFIPQDMTDDVTMEVEFHVWDGSKNQETKTLTVNFGKIAKENTLTSSWKAGELRTFSLKPNTVDVDITDDMKEYVKSNVVIKNTGNVHMYVRANIIANWVGQPTLDAEGNLGEETILMGYADTTGTATTKPWNDKDGQTSYGKFENLPGENWVQHDKYYYYTNPIGPGAYVPSTNPLFKSYTVGESPAYWIADMWGTRRKAKNVHLVMDIMVQSIEAPMNADGTAAKTYEEAWKDALNKTSLDE